MERTIELALAADCPVIIMAAVPKPTPEEANNNPALARELADTALKVAKRLQDAGFETGCHDHDRDHMVFVDGRESLMDYLLRNTGNDYMYMIDTGNAMAGGVPLRCICGKLKQPSSSNFIYPKLPGLFETDRGVLHLIGITPCNL